MEQVTLKIRPEPVRYAGYSMGTTFPQAGYLTGLAMGQEFDSEISYPLSELRIIPKPNATVVQLRDGSSRSTIKGPPKVELEVKLSAMSPTELSAFYDILRSGRNISLGAWWDHTTQFMSHFGGAGQEGEGYDNVSEIGIASAVGRRDGAPPTAGYWEHPVAGTRALYTRLSTDLGVSHYQPKIVRGMIGTAILLESRRANLAVRRYTSGSNYLFSTVSTGVKSTPSHLSNLPIGGATSLRFPYDAVLPSTEYVATGTQTLANATKHYAYVYAWGSGQVMLAWQEASVDVAVGSAVTLTDTPQLVGLRFTTSATTGKFRIYGVGHAIVSLLQVEEGDGPTSFMDYSSIAAGSGDYVGTGEDLDSGPWSITSWIQWREDADEKYWFIANPTAGTAALYAKFVGTSLKVQMGSTEHSFGVGTVANGTWTQFILTYEPATATGVAKLRLIVNGVSGGTATISGTDFVGTTYGLNFGNDFAASFSGKSLNMAMDAARIDSRIWTVAQALADYNVRTDTGIQAILKYIQGRYFRPTAQFSTQGPYTDAWDLSLRLEQADVRRQSVF